MRLPFKQDLINLFFFGNDFNDSIILFFFFFNISTASFSKLGEITTSQNNLSILTAVSLSIFVLEIKIPPNAEIGSASSAAS